jgi:hypothetical protein
VASAFVSTGNGATAALTTSTFVSSVVSIDLGSNTGGVIDVSHLGSSTWKDFKPFDLADTPEVTVTFQHDGSAVEVAANTVDTLTVTFNQDTGMSTAPSLAGTGVLTSWNYPTLANDAVNEASFTFKFDGNTGPTWTKST